MNSFYWYRKKFPNCQILRITLIENAFLSQFVFLNSSVCVHSVMLMFVVRTWHQHLNPRPLIILIVRIRRIINLMSKNNAVVRCIEIVHWILCLAFKIYNKWFSKYQHIWTIIIIVVYQIPNATENKCIIKYKWNRIAGAKCNQCSFYNVTINDILYFWLLNPII